MCRCRWLSYLDYLNKMAAKKKTTAAKAKAAKKTTTQKTTQRAAKKVPFKLDSAIPAGAMGEKVPMRPKCLKIKV